MKEFKTFILRGNVVDLAIGIVIGAAFGAIIISLVNDMVMPPIGLALGKVDFSNLFIVLREGTTPGPYITLAAAKTAGAITMNYGLFINSIITFLIVAAVIFFFVVKPVARMMAPKKVAAPAPTTKECPHCYTTIPVKATRCPNCTSELGH